MGKKKPHVILGFGVVQIRTHVLYCLLKLIMNMEIYDWDYKSMESTGSWGNKGSESTESWGDKESESTLITSGGGKDWRAQESESQENLQLLPL